MNGLTPTGSVFNNFDDIVDIAIMTDKTVDEALKQMEKDEMDGVTYGSPFAEAAEEFFDEEVKISNDVSTEDLPMYSMNIADIAADDYIDAYQDLNHGIGMDIGDMIDMIADQ